MKKNEKNIDEQIKENNQEYASNFWQHGLNQMLAKTGITNIYDLSNPFRDMTEENFWHFLQKSHVRKSIHVGGIKFKDGKNVSTNVYHHKILYRSPDHVKVNCRPKVHCT